MTIAYVCYRSEGLYSILNDENEQLLRYLQQQGLDIRKEIWDDPEVNWRVYDLAVLKAPWDYVAKYPQFLHWLDRLDALRLPLLNPTATVRWNADKHYLQQIADAGLPVIPTLFLEPGTEPQLQRYFDALQTQKLIIKPAVSGGAHNTFALTRPEAEQLEARLHRLLEQEAFLVQPFLPQIQQEGEWSFMFFNGVLSHTLRKRPKAGDFRVQHVHGGSVEAVKPSADLQAQARQYVDLFAPGCLYARVDGVLLDGQLTLMELELIEPYLYLDASPEGFAHYLHALKQQLAQLSK